MYLPLKALPMKVGFDDDGATAPAGSGADTVQGSAGTDGMLTQEQFNKALAEDRRKHQAKYEKLEQTHAALLENKNLTDQQRKELETSLEDLRSQFQTKEQQAETERVKLVERHSNEVKKLTEERDQWQQSYTNMVISNSLITAASEAEAWNPTQIEAILRPQTRLADELGEDGKKTGRLIPRVKMMGNDKDGKTVELDLSVGDAVKLMRETPEKFGNLFKSTANSGLGANPTGKPGTQPDLAKIAQDPAAYRKLRKENPGALGL